jgi:hypothetical protein
LRRDGGVSRVATRAAARHPDPELRRRHPRRSILTGGAFTMTSDMSMTYAAAPPYIIGLDDEFCFGQSRDAAPLKMRPAEYEREIRLPFEQSIIRVCSKARGLVGRSTHG